LRKRRWLLIIVGLAIIVGASLPPFMSASCFTRQQTSAELRALENLRTMTRNGVLPAEDVVTRIENDYPRTRAAGLARLLRARIKLSNKDYAGAATLLDTGVIRDHTELGDYGLFMRGDALEQAGKRPEARLVFEKLDNDYPSSIRAGNAKVRAANLALQLGEAPKAIASVSDLAAKDDAGALLLTAKAYEQQGDSTNAVKSYRRIYFYAPVSAESTVAATAMTRLGSSTAPGNAQEGLARGDRLFEVKRYVESFDAYSQTLTSFPNSANAQDNLQRGIAASYLRKTAEAASALISVPASAGETRAQALYYLAQTYARARQWPQVRTTLEELRRSFPNSSWAPKAYTNAGLIADETKNTSEATSIYQAAINAFPGSVDVAQAQFNLAWAAHDARNFQESSRLLTEHLANYADKNTDNRGKAGYWAARDSERAGKLAEARALYQGVLGRYDANWYGYLAKQRLDVMPRPAGGQQGFASESLIGRAVANLQTVTVAEETAGSEVDTALTKSEQLANIGLDDWALEEVSRISDAAPFSPRINLAAARIYRGEEDNVRALNILKKSYPDYSQMKPEELTREEWDVFYPLAYWDIISQESRARSLDPYQVAGLIRQETVFNPRSRSGAAAYGLMQVLVPTGRLTAQKYGVQRTITADSLYEPRLNIQLGTAYLRDQIDKFGRIEYVAAAYNAGPMRVPQWRASLPSEMDEWSEAVPFKETRGYIQGVVRNRLQYLRLYDQNGKFRPEVGSRAVNAPAQATPTPVDPNVRKRRIIGSEEE
jgi:soluble lytic murein transglycosylase